MEVNMQKANMLTVFRGNVVAAKEMYDKIAGYGKNGPYEKSGLIEVQKTMMNFGTDSNKAFHIPLQSHRCYKRFR